MVAIARVGGAEGHEAGAHEAGLLSELAVSQYQTGNVLEHSIASLGIDSSQSRC